MKRWRGTRNRIDRFDSGVCGFNPTDELVPMNKLKKIVLDSWLGALKVLLAEDVTEVMVNARRFISSAVGVEDVTLPTRVMMR